MVTIKAAIFVTDGAFVDFYDACTPSAMHGTNLPTGDIVFRIAQELVADILLAEPT